MQRSVKGTAAHTRPDRFSGIVMKRPRLVVTLCFIGAMLLLIAVGLRQLYNMTRNDLHSRQRDLEVRAVGVDALIEAERRRLMFLRNFAEHQLSAHEQPSPAEQTAVMKALAASTQPVWHIAGALDGPNVYGTNAAGLAGLEGFQRDSATLPGDIALARAISPLVQISQHADAVQSTVAFISSNGLFVIAPENQGRTVPELLRRFSTMNYYRGQLPASNPARDVLWTPVYTGLQKGESISTLSAPIYAGNHFRGAVVMDITQSRLLSLQLSSGQTDDDDENNVIEFGLLNSNGHVVYFRNGALTEQPPAGFNAALLRIAQTSADRWMQKGSGYVEHRGTYLLYQRVGQTHWMLLAPTDNTELTLAAARRVFNSPVIAAWVVLILLLMGTLRIVTNIFSHYVEASERLEMLARSDPLTGLANRRRFKEAFAQALERAERAERADHNSNDEGTQATPARMAVLMLDIDFFKRVNDRYGHAAGDRVLSIFAHLLHANLRSVDLPARVGGEEFAALLPDADLASAAAVAERVRSAVEAHARDSRASAGSADAIAFTVSIGVAASPEDGAADYEALMQVADRRLYLAKESGRNRVVHADPQKH
ncbi:diguanylate cyclase (GGDEF)-like protein [Paraburkholderia bannensis]|uniref:diguanylate cyclase n=1 Tax=Paraburkholderia bannensis TaxID=765414 RepID=A0A7W9TVJ7_9BURK|nr:MULTISPECIES: diguanylate cyclase [Paraburkholderia]MBB3257377.1 diguanylate cyclase (GGDEF)-like protein [Paraburkholderia sp. WP4_3_2]MBB6102227.1 diguanylate cyclase (GGDEF)-like protein [Paraburkholderia bannensis]